MKGNVARCKLCLGKLKAINEVRCNQMRLHDDSRRGPRTRRWHCTLEILVRWTDCWGGGSASGEARLGEPGQSPHARSWLVSVNERLTSRDPNLREGRSAPRCARRAAHARRDSKCKTECDVKTAQGRRLAKVACTLTALVFGQRPRRC